MTSRYRAGQRVAAILSELQDQGLTTSEIALELQQRGVLMRGAAVDPVADLCDNVRDIVADFAAAVGQPADEVTALRARAEAAEQRAEAAEREVARVQTERERARVDACLMLSLAWATDAPMLIGACSINGASTAEIVALRGLCEKTIAADRPGDLLAAIRRVLHHEGTAVRGSAACVAAVVAGRPAGEVADPVTP